eukprot:m.26307 g.26307  ORF g.26307 m.26307 type:complete len:69 (-) comp6291_c0_seq1:50-256(-)
MLVILRVSGSTSEIENSIFQLANHEQMSLLLHGTRMKIDGSSAKLTIERDEVAASIQFECVLSLFSAK